MKDNFSSAFESKVLKALTELASKIAEDAKENAKGLPEEIQSAIQVGDAKSQGNGNFSISVKIDLNKAEMAAAYEFGSGIHSTRKQRKKYKIPAGDLGYLAWPIDRWPNYVPPPNVKKTFVFPGMVSAKDYVMHPGVEAKPYLTPALKDNIKLITFNLSRSFLGTIQEITPKVVIIKKET